MGGTRKSRVRIFYKAGRRKQKVEEKRKKYADLNDFFNGRIDQKKRGVAD
jgi:hypothetical protein